MHPWVSLHGPGPGTLLPEPPAGGPLLSHTGERPDGSLPHHVPVGGSTTRSLPGRALPAAVLHAPQQHLSTWTGTAPFLPRPRAPRPPDTAPCTLAPAPAHVTLAHRARARARCASHRTRATSPGLWCAQGPPSSWPHDVFPSISRGGQEPPAILRQTRYLQMAGRTSVGPTARRKQGSGRRSALQS